MDIAAAVPHQTAMQPRPGTTETLARFVVETKWQDIPDSARHEAKRALLNFFAVALAGCRTEPVAMALKSLAQFSGGREATVVGRRERIDALSAAFLNAAGANVFDYCDTHLPTVVHPTSPLAPAALAMAELQCVTGPEFLTAFVLGFEIECRIGAAISPGHYPKGWHITSTCGVFAAAAAAGKLLGLGVQPMVWALGTAATQSAGLCECLGWPAKSVSVGNAARNGLWSALLAAQGFAGPPEPLAGSQGFFAVMDEPVDWSGLLDGLGQSWQVANNSLKPYPSGFVIHPLLDLALDWRRAHPDAAVEAVRARGNPLLLQRADRPGVKTGREAQVSLQHAVAAALVRGRAGLAEFTDACVADPAVSAMRRKVEVAAKDGLSTIAAEMDIVTADGRTHTLATEAARGSAANPLKDAEIEDKLRTEADGWQKGRAVQPLIDAIWALDKSDDAAALARLAVPA
ncbi:MAG: MmgE/PrpD family protein [Rhodospirillaceae bacterium]